MVLENNLSKLKVTLPFPTTISNNNHTSKSA